MKRQLELAQRSAQVRLFATGPIGHSIRIELGIGDELEGAVPEARALVLHNDVPSCPSAAFLSHCISSSHCIRLPRL